MSGTACFFCKNSINGRIASTDGCGWSYDCSKGINNTDLNGEEDVTITCPEADPRFGFQIGGTWTHMWFERDGDGGCLDWIIMSDGEHPVRDEQDGFRFHICDFLQMEEFVKFWKPILEQRGWLREGE